MNKISVGRKAERAQINFMSGIFEFVNRRVLTLPQR